MPSDEDFINLDKRAEDLEEAELQDVKEIKALKAEIADLRKNVKDILEIMGVLRHIPFVQPGMLLPEEQKIYNDALVRLRQEYVDPSSLLR